MAKYIVTGFAGFIGYHLTKRLLEEGHEVVGIDRYNPERDREILKRYRRNKLSQWESNGQLISHNIDLCYSTVFSSIITPCDAIYHLAAIPGVRASFEYPGMYVENNIIGSINVLKAAGEYGVGKVILASSSSVYGDIASTCAHRGIDDGEFISVSEVILNDRPLSPYAMTKRAMELAGYTYHMLYGYDVIIPRFFTVYGPAGRPDMAYYKFIKAALAGEAIDVYGDGEQVRDFTYINDIVDGLMGLPGLSGMMCVNLGSGNPLSINTLIKTISDTTGKGISINRLEPQPGDVRATFADNSKAKELLGWEPKWNLRDGIAETVKWFKTTDFTEMEGAK